MKFLAPRGTKDILPKEARLFQKLEQASRQIFLNYNYKELRTPVFEDIKLFQRTLGQTTDVVQKQLLRLETEGDDDFALRPEATASIVRAYIEHDLHQKEGFSKYFYIGPMFRGERPQKGRLREFHHIGAEAIGSLNPYLDAELISLAVKLIESFGIEGYTLNINNLGCSKDKENWSKLLRSTLKDKIGSFCSLCQDRFQRNVFRILDCKNEDCKDALKKITLQENHICSSCHDHFSIVQDALRNLKIDFKVSPFLVRGLDYYTRTVFEITHSSLGSQDALGAGGRYDNLISQLGGPDLSAVGFALGMERVLLAVKKTEDLQDSINVYFVTLDKESRKKGFLLLNKLRNENISCDMDYEESSLKSQMRSANKSGAKCVAIIGEDELKTDTVTLKDMSSGNQETIKTNQLINELKKKL